MAQTSCEAELDDPFMLLLRKRAIRSREERGIPFSQDDTTQNWPVRLATPPSVHEFRKIIEQHVPVVIGGCMTDRPRLSKWKDTNYLESRMGSDRKVMVAITPDGRADDLITHP